MTMAARDVFGTEEAKARLDDAIAAAQSLLESVSETRAQRRAMLDQARSLPAGPVRQALENVAGIISEDVLNAAQLSAQFRVEAATFVPDFHLAEGPRRSVYARSLLLALYASAQGLCAMTGKRFREDVSRMLGDVALPILNRNGRVINATFDEVRQRFGVVRNKAAAHRDAYAFVHDVALSAEDEESISHLATTLLKSLNELQVVHGSYMVEVCNRLRAWSQGRLE